MASNGSNIVDDGWEICRARRPCNILRDHYSDEARKTTKTLSRGRIFMDLILHFMKQKRHLLDRSSSQVFICGY